MNATEFTFYEILAQHYTKPIRPCDPDPYVGFNWVSIARYFGEGTTWSSRVPGITQNPMADPPPCPELAGAQVSFTLTATDNCQTNVEVTCTPASGSFFTLGTNTVTCVAVDESGNSNSCSFTVTVTDPTPPVLSIHRQDRDVLICWPLTCTRFILEQKTDLNPVTRWEAIGTPVIPINGGNCVSLPIGTNNLFFRLRQEQN